MTGKKPNGKLLVENQALRLRLAKAEETPRATENGKVSAFLVSGFEGRQNEEVLASVNLANSIIDQAGDVIIVCDAQGMILRASRRSHLLCGKNPVGSFFSELLPLELTDTSKLFSVANPLQGKRFENVEVVFKKGNGQISLLTLDAAPLSDDQHHVIGCIVTLKDVTERKRTENALCQSEERLALAASATQVGMFDLDLAKGKVLWTQTHEAIFGYTPAATTPTTAATPAINATTEHDNRKWTERVHPDDLPFVEEESRRCMEGRQPVKVQYRIIWPDGSLHWVETKGVFLYDSDGKAGRLLGVVVEITETKQAEEALRVSEIQFRALFESSSVGNAMADPKTGRFLLVNDSFCKITGYSQEELLQKTFQDLTHPEDRGYDGELYEAARQHNSTWNSEKRYLRKDGSVAWVVVSGTLWFATDGQPQRSIAAISDITERKRAEESLLVLNKELESRVAARTGELAASVEILKTEIRERELAEEGLLRLNRLYLVLSQTNQAIVRARDRDTLFADFCRIAVEDGGFILAWVGLVNEESGQLQVAASFGATGYLDGIEVTATNDPSGLGPTGISVRTGSYFICNDFLASPKTRPWHERGAAYGIRASASIPLQLEGKVIGALTLYADEKDFFDEQQTSLLQQMGADFSFALDNIHREVKRREVERALHEQTIERLQAVEALREKEQMLIQQSRQAAMGEMISNIAHQWRQPLNVLGLSIQELKMMYDLGECNGEYLAKSVKRSFGLIQHMSQTIDDFRDYFRPDRDKTKFQVSEVIASTLLLVEDSFKHQQVDIKIVTKNAPAIFGYKNEFAQSLLNILNNARDAFNKGKIEHPEVTVTICSENDRAVVTVADNAGGIPQENIDKIFDPYFTTKGPQAGTGLGLFMSKSIVEKKLGGSLTVRNIGDGAEFRIEI
jgi:PAS domain S-box-containing protein